jgi:hypothetical protein
LEKLLIFTANPAIMKLIKLTALSSLLFALVFGITSCEKNAEQKKTTNYEKKSIVLSGAQVAPVASPSTALGSMDVSYDKGTRILSYTISWSGLSGSVASMGVFGPAPAGYPAASTTPVQTFSTSAIVRCPTISNTTCGTYTGTLLADGSVVKEDDILNGVYYVSIRTATNSLFSTFGEIRGQIVFQ